MRALFLVAIIVMIKKNEAFIYFSNLFHDSNLPVPHIVHVSDDKTIYFQTYISELSLFDLLKIKNFIMTMK